MSIGERGGESSRLARLGGLQTVVGSGMVVTHLIFACASASPPLVGSAMLLLSSTPLFKMYGKLRDRIGNEQKLSY